MQADYLIIGQGLCGTWLSYYLEQAGQSFLVIDQNNPFTASKVASGIINPVTGRRIVPTWMIDELLPFAWKAYQDLGLSLGIDCISEKPVLDCFTTPQMRMAFMTRYEKDKRFLSLPENENDWRPWLNYDFGYGLVQPAYLVNIALLLQQQRKKLSAAGLLLEENFDAASLTTTAAHIRYKNITARKIFFCDGAGGYNNPFFSPLPYGLNKGEMVLVEIPGFPATHIIKKGFSLVPWGENRFWLGSTYLWEFEDEHPTPGFYQFATSWLQQTLNNDFTIVAHWAALRPATLERKPFVGLHPANPALGILNGMGTKGCSLAPFFARQLVEHLVHGLPILPEANVQRFSRLLARQAG